VRDGCTRKCYTRRAGMGSPRRSVGAAPCAMLAPVMVAKRVLLVAESLRRGGSGIARVARLVARVLAEQRAAGQLDARALCLNDRAPVEDLGLPVATAMGSRPRFVRDVHLSALRCDAMIYDFAGMARAHPRLFGLRRPHLVWMHGIEVWEHARVDHLARLRAADVLVAPSAYTRARAMALHGGLDHARVCALATEEDDAAPSPTFAAPPTALILARLDEGGGYKGHRELIACWPEVLRQVPAAQLVIAGDGPGRAVIEALVRRSPAHAQIALRGFVDESELAALFARAWVLAMPSRGEGFGVAYVEAMRHGLPVLGSIHDAAREVNAEAESGHNVDLDSPASLASALCRMLGDAPTCLRLGAGARARWQRDYRYAAFAQRFRPMLAALLER